MRQRVIVTIDTEGHDGINPIKHLIFGETSEGVFGVEYIMDELDAQGIKALFFVDFAEAWDYGEDKIRRVVETIQKHGHNVGVHIHPDHMADKKRLFLYEYTRAEQYDMIYKCTEMYERIIGKKPLSFRAGKYSANLDTLDILDELGYKYDFSSFYHQKWCGIDPAFTVNSPCQYKGIIEFPVTMHTSFKMWSVKREDKIDIEGMKSSELRYALDEVVRQEFPVVITLFFHSFSLLDWRNRPDNPRKNNKKIKRFKQALQMVHNNDWLEVIDEDGLCDIYPVSQKDAIKSEIIWKSKAKGVWYTLLKAAMIASFNQKARRLLICVCGSIIVFLFLIALMLLRFVK